MRPHLVYRVDVETSEGVDSSLSLPEILQPSRRQSGRWGPWSFF